MPKLRDEIPFSAYIAAKLACERFRGEIHDRGTVDLDLLARSEPSRSRVFERDEDDVVMTIN